MRSGAQWQNFGSPEDNWEKNVWSLGPKRSELYVCEVKTSLQSERLPAAGFLHLSSRVSASLNKKNFLLCVLICTFFTLWGRFFSLPAPTCCPPPPPRWSCSTFLLFIPLITPDQTDRFNSWKRAVVVWAWAERRAAAGLRSQVFSPGQSSVCWTQYAVRTQKKHVKTSEQNQSTLPQQAEVSGWRSACCLSAHSAATRWASSSSDVSLCSWINCRENHEEIWIWIETSEFAHQSAAHQIHKLYWLSVNWLE